MDKSDESNYNAKGLTLLSKEDDIRTLHVYEYNLDLLDSKFDPWVEPPCPSYITISKRKENDQNTE